MTRTSIPAELKRRVLVEAGHRCAIPVCRQTPVEIAHITPWANEREHAFENLIALCPTCHTRYDLGTAIDRSAMRMYKQNLGLLNHRYGEYERRQFAVLAASGEECFVLGPGGDVLVGNAILDGLFELLPSDPVKFGTDYQVDGETRYAEFPGSFVFRVTAAGAEFISRYAAGQSLPGSDSEDAEE